eukprot:6203110-Pleurochrysis_carterae.AAC.7
MQAASHFGGPDGLVECRRRARCGGGDAVGPVAPVGRRLIVDEDALKVLAAESPVKREVAHQEPARALAPAVRPAVAKDTEGGNKSSSTHARTRSVHACVLACMCERALASLCVRSFNI